MATRSQIKRSRLLAEALGNEATSTAPVGHWTQGLARVLQGGMAGYQDRKADSMEGERNQQLAQALGGDMNPNEMRNYGAVNEFPELMDMANRREDQQNWQTQFDYGKSKDTRDFGYRKGRDTVQDSQWGQGHQLQQDQFGLENEKWDFTKSQPFEVGGNLVDRETYKPLYESPASPATVINTGGDNDTLRKELSKGEAKTWSEFQNAGNTAGDMMRDMQVVDELLTVAPQGPIPGRLTTMFPGVSTAADAANSILFRVAPAQRTPGTGAQSDIEYEGLLKSMPRLMNQPGANRLISAVIKGKAQVNMERADTVSKFQNGEITEVQARTALTEINRRSILSPELKQLIGVETGDQPQPGATDPALEDALKMYPPDPR